MIHQGTIYGKNKNILVSDMKRCREAGEATALRLLQSSSVFSSMDVVCSLNELAQLMTMNNSDGFRLYMRMLHGKKFIDGTYIGLLEDKSSSIEDGILSAKWFSYKEKQYLGNARDFYMLDYSKMFVKKGGRRTLVRLMQPMFTEEDGLANAIARMEYAIIAEEISPTRLKLSCTCRSLEESNAEMKCIAESMVQDTMNNIKNVLVTARLSQLEMVKQEDWVIKKNRKRCGICTESFSAFQRKYHCQMCGDVVCRDCMANHVVHTELDGVQRLKVCFTCCVTRKQRILERAASLDVPVSALGVQAKNAHSLDGQYRNTTTNMPTLEDIFKPPTVKSIQRQTIQESDVVHAVNSVDCAKECCRLASDIEDSPHTMMRKLIDHKNVDSDVGTTDDDDNSYASDDDSMPMLEELIPFTVLEIKN